MDLLTQCPVTTPGLDLGLGHQNRLGTLLKDRDHHVQDQGHRDQDQSQYQDHQGQELDRAGQGPGHLTSRLSSQSQVLEEQSQHHFQILPP